MACVAIWLCSGWRGFFKNSSPLKSLPFDRLSSFAIPFLKKSSCRDTSPCVHPLPSVLNASILRSYHEGKWVESRDVLLAVFGGGL